MAIDPVGIIAGLFLDDAFENDRGRKSDNDLARIVLSALEARGLRIVGPESTENMLGRFADRDMAAFYWRTAHAAAPTYGDK